MKKLMLIGPFTQIVTMDNLPLSGPITDAALRIIDHGGIVLEDQKILKILPEDEFKRSRADTDLKGHYTEIEGDAVLFPGFIDSHTHICYAGSRITDYALRVSGISYLEIAKKGGGILSTVSLTRKASQDALESLLLKRTLAHLKRGVTTCEVKSGYGLTKESELTMLRAINAVMRNAENPADAKNASLLPDLIPTCLAAHCKPGEFQTPEEYLAYVSGEIIPSVKSERLCARVDIFIEDGAFKPDTALPFLKNAKENGFTLTVHADQFTSGGAVVAALAGAISADHLEAIVQKDIMLLKNSNVVATVLPGASLGLGVAFAPARKIIDAGCTLAIASDWNPGSAPMGDLLLQAAVLGANQKLTIAETLAAITVRAATALGLTDRGTLKPGFLADMISFPCADYREILYNQGSLKPHMVWKKGRRISS